MQLDGFKEYLVPTSTYICELVNSFFFERLTGPSAVDHLALAATSEAPGHGAVPHRQDGEA